MNIKGLYLLLIFYLFIIKTKSSSLVEYYKIRNQILDDEKNLRFGGFTLLNDKEEIVNKYLLNLKNKEINNGLKDLDTYAPSLHYSKAKSLIENSEVFQFIKKMPKGANLHGHNIEMVSAEWIIKNITYMPGLMSCHDNNNIIILSFRKNKNCINEPKLVSELRAQAENTNDYDLSLRKLIELDTKNYFDKYHNINDVWKKFQQTLITNDFITYKPVFELFHYQMLQELYDDNIMCAEIRVTFSSNILYNNDGKVYNEFDTATLLKSVVEQFKKSHPDFIGVKIIFSTSRRQSIETLENRIEIFNRLFKEMPNFIVGFDIDNQEDLGKPLIEFVSQLQALSNGGARLLLHAGETNWYGAAELNILDAILLNTARIGHGFGIAKHPIMWNFIKTKDIAIEISPISNQMFSLVKDLRNHPAVYFMSENLPIVIGNDNPRLWNVTGLSYDFYYAFMAFTPVDAGLNILKQIALNSLKYSILNEEEKLKATELFNSKWNQYLENVITEKNL